MLNFLSDNTAIVTLLVLTLLVLLLLAIIIWAAIKGAEKQDQPASQKPRLISADSLKQSFRAALELIESNIAARSERYNLSWTLILNEGQQGRELPLVQSGLQSALSADSTMTAAAQGISWNFFDKGVVVQLQSDYLGSPDPEAFAGNNTWDDFLGLCRNYRPDRPFDSIVLSIPASVFLRTDSQGQLELAARAKSIHRRLWLAQNRLALRFPVYVAIADCEVIPGFATFAAALPEPMRRSILGWSSPFELVAPFQGQWIDTAMNEITRSVSDSCAELCALEPAESDSSEYFMLPNEVEHLRAGLKLFAEELMRPSAYHEPFLLRGIYLTGDCSETAALLGHDAGAPAGMLAGMDGMPISAPGYQDTLPEFAPPGPIEPALDERSAALTAASADALGLALGTGLAMGQGNAVPAFLRDIFERKIFAEVGLVRSSSVHKMRRPAMSRVAHWSAIAVPLVWLVGLGISTVRLNHLTADVVVYLQKLDRDSRDSLQASSHNVVDPVQSRQRAMDALTNIEQMDSARLSSIFMPGSWPWFDDLHQRVRFRLEKGFADNSFDPVRRAAYNQVSILTGVPIDPVTGSLIIGASCTLPSRWSELTATRAPTALNIEDLPEFNATLQYVARIEQMDAVLRAMMRLKNTSSGPASGEDLSLVVRVLLGAELNGNPTRTAQLFRQVAQSVQSLTIEPLQEASACSLKLAMKATFKRLYSNNGLLTAEQAITDSSAALFDSQPKAADVAGTIAIWQTLRGALHDQEAYLVAGKGAWMHRNTLQLGQAYDDLIAKIQGISLLGKSSAADAQRQADTGFTQFTSSWDATLSADSHSQGLSSGLEWNDTTGAWAFAADRKALLDALTALLSQPFMKINTLSKFPDVPVGATVSWDRSKLDQVLALSDARKHFQTDTQPKFPATLQTAAGELVDAALGETARDLLSQSFTVSTREVQAPATEADRARALKVRTWLQELGAQGVAETMSAVLSRDALSRLQLLDDTFTRAEVFVPRDRGFHGWNGEKMPLLDAFGAADPANLGAYVTQQQSFIDATGKDAEGLLMQLGGAQSNALVMRWQALVADLNRYRLKSPTSSLMTLEHFVLTGGAEIDIGNCLDKLSARSVQRRATDVFSERLLGLQAGLYSRCRELKQTEFQDAWNRFADAFNRDLANRVPFRTLSSNAAANGASIERTAADVDEVGNVVKLFDRSHALAVASSRDPSRPSASSTVRKVDDQMQKVREFLAPLFPAEEGQLAGLDVSVEFRANAAGELEGNKIIEWALTIGNQTLRQRDPARPLHWEPGQPVMLTLRVARDGPIVPHAEPGHAGMSVDDRTVSYRFDDPWALFTFVSNYREQDAPAGADARSQLLRFDFPVSSVGASGGAGGAEAVKIATRESRARVYIRLSVSAAGKRAPLAWPGVFPVKAPAW